MPLSSISDLGREMFERIRTDYWAKPIPDRRFDWSATYDDYEADCDQDGFFSTSPVGYGRTEAEAVIDLIENNYRGVECERHALRTNDDRTDASKDGSPS